MRPFILYHLIPRPAPIISVTLLTRNSAALTNVTSYTLPDEGQEELTTHVIQFKHLGARLLQIIQKHTTCKWCLLFYSSDTITFQSY